MDTSVPPVPLVGLGTLHSTTTAYRFALSSRSVASASMTYSYELLRTSCAMLYRIFYALALNTSHGHMPAPDGNMPVEKAVWLLRMLRAMTKSWKRSMPSTASTTVCVCGVIQADSATELFVAATLRTALHASDVG